MKKSLLYLAGCALLLSACTSEDVIEESPQSNTISFRNVVSKPSALNAPSRALDINSFNKFFVYGFYTKGNNLNERSNVFTDTPVNKSDGGWKSAIERHWVEGAKYSFYAYSCENSDIAQQYGGASVGQSDDIFRINYTNHSTSGNSHDLLFASATGIIGKLTGNLPVPLQFKHILSKISLKFISEFPEEYQIEISNVSISGFENMGTFTASTTGNSEGTWDGVKYDVNNINSFSLSTLGSNKTSSKKNPNGSYVLPPIETSACFMIPNHYQAVVGGDNPVKIKFNIKLINTNLSGGSQVVASNTLVGSWHPNWRAGTQYVYTVRLDGDDTGMEKITFDVGLTDWNDPEADNVPETINISLDYSLTPIAE